MVVDGSGWRTTGGSPAGDPGTLATGWRLAAERGGPALLLLPSDGAPDAPPALAVGWTNASLHELLGVPGAELLGRAPEELPVPGLAAALRRLLHDADDDPAAAVDHPDGTRRPVRVSVEVLPPPADGRLVTVTPVTDTEQAALSAAREAEQRFRALAEHAPVGILASEIGIRLGYVNTRFAELLDAAVGELVGTRWLDRIDRPDRAGLSETLQDVLTGAAAERSVRVVAQDGKRRWVHLRLAPTTTTGRAAGFIGTAEDVTDRRAREEQMSYQAGHDPLTGLVNRRLLVARLQELLVGGRGTDRAFALLLLDLDGFKAINDEHGHEAGDRVLVEVAARMRQVARGGDVVARLAGDEFVIVASRVTDAAGAVTVGRRHLERLTAPSLLAGARDGVPASIGAALPAPEDTPESLLRAADRALFAAKAAGRAEVHVAARDEGSGR